MIAATHTILYSKRASAVRAFLRRVLGLKSVDAGGGWLIFRSPPAEIAVHPTDKRGRHELFLMCADVEATVRRLKKKGVKFATPVTDQAWGLLTRMKLPDGETIGLYQPKHKTAVRMRKPRRR